jgi:glycosyltransferase involved in cell wall biosynthesis
MKILTVHNRYRIRGGEDESHDLEVALLRSRGLEVYDYIEDNRNLNGNFPIAAGIKVFWNQQAYSSVRKLIREHRFDVMKVDNLFPIISPSVFHAAADEGVPVVQTIRNFRGMCVDGVLFREESICEECVGKPIALPGIVHACYRNSRLQSSLVTFSNLAHRSVFKSHKYVSAFIAASQFMRTMLIRMGNPADFIHVKPNFISDSGEGSGEGGFALYVGRLTREKGVLTLLSAWERLQGRMELKIVGDGPLSDEVRQRSAAIPGVEYLGRKPLPKVSAKMGEAKVLIFPSEWYETFGRTIVEAYAKGTPVISANLGAMKELVVDGETGLLFKPGDVNDLVEKIDWACANPESMKAMRAKARAKYLDEFTESRNFEIFMRIFESAIVRRRQMCEAT